MNEHDQDAAAEIDETNQEYLTYEISSDERPSEAVVYAVATLTETSPLDLTPLYDAIDPDHLDGLIERWTTDTGDKQSLSFRYNGCTVTIRSERVQVQRNEECD